MIFAIGGSKPKQHLAKDEEKEKARCHAIANIATTLSLSPKTVETYRARMMEKLDIHDFATLIKFAIQHGITSLE